LTFGVHQECTFRHDVPYSQGVSVEAADLPWRSGGSRRQERVLLLGLPSTVGKGSGSMTAPLEAYSLGPTDGEPMWVLGGLYTWKALGDQSGGDYSLCEVRGPAGFAAPLHSHERENEGFYVASGEVTLILGDDEARLVEGGFGFAPAGASHTFRLDSPEARLLLLITPGAAGHEGMFAEMGEPARDHVLPEPPDGPPDFASLAAIAARHGTMILGPPPGVGS
jgi:quercetin dioxygenase-like cupin family protein